MSPQYMAVVALLLAVASARPSSLVAAGTDTDVDTKPSQAGAADNPTEPFQAGEADNHGVAIKALTDATKDIEDDAFWMGETGDMFKNHPQDNREAVGGCLLDKAVAIVDELAVRDHAGELAHDLAACCTRGSTIVQVQCIRDAALGFNMIMNAAEKCQHLLGLPWGANCLDRISAKAARLLIRAGQKRIKASHLASMSGFFTARCGSKPEACMQKVMNDAYDEEPEDLANVRMTMEHNAAIMKGEQIKERAVEDTPESEEYKYDAHPRDTRMVHSRYADKDIGARVVEVYRPEKKKEKKAAHASLLEIETTTLVLR